MTYYDYSVPQFSNDNNFDQQLDAIYPSTSSPNETSESIENTDTNEIVNQISYITKDIVHTPELTSKDGKKSLSLSYNSF